MRIQTKLEVIGWHVENGGRKGYRDIPRGRLAGHALRLLHETVELCLAAGASPTEVQERVEYELKKAEGRPPGSISDEVADTAILHAILAYHADLDVDAEVLKKLLVLRERKWRADLDGVLWRPGNSFHEKKGDKR